MFPASVFPPSVFPESVFPHLNIVQPPVVKNIFPESVFPDSVFPESIFPKTIEQVPDTIIAVPSKPFNFELLAPAVSIIAPGVTARIEQKANQPGRGNTLFSLTINPPSDYITNFNHILIACYTAREGVPNSIGPTDNGTVGNSWQLLYSGGASSSFIRLSMQIWWKFADGDETVVELQGSNDADVGATFAVYQVSGLNINDPFDQLGISTSNVFPVPSLRFTLPAPTAQDESFLMAFTASGIYETTNNMTYTPYMVPEDFVGADGLAGADPVTMNLGIENTEISAQYTRDAIRSPNAVMHGAMLAWNVGVSTIIEVSGPQQFNFVLHPPVIAADLLNEVPRKLFNFQLLTPEFEVIDGTLIQVPTKTFNFNMLPPSYLTDLLNQVPRKQFTFNPLAPSLFIVTDVVSEVPAKLFNYAKFAPTFDSPVILEVPLKRFEFLPLAPGIIANRFVKGSARDIDLTPPRELSPEEVRWFVNNFGILRNILENGVSGVFETVDGKTLVVQNGIIEQILE